jgi:glycosyltransferase involved in cell wall biosynthesis
MTLSIESIGRVSVVIPLYNHASYIVSALNSVIDQGRLVKEVIVIDDGSKDSSLSVAKEFAANHPHIRVTGQDNSGAAPTLNRGVRTATGDYIAILNSDDLWAPGRLEPLVTALDLDAGLDLATSGISFINGDGAEIPNVWYEEALDNFIGRRDLGLALMDANFLMTTSNFVVRRSVFTELNGFADLRYAHDMDFGLRLAANHRRIGFIDRKLLAYRLHETNTIKENHANVRLDWAMVASFFLWSLSRQASGDTERIRQGWQILERHGLNRAAQDCVRYFDSNPSASLATNSLLINAPMKSKLLSAV